MKYLSILLLAGIAMLTPGALYAQSANDAAQSWSQQADRFSENLKAKLAEANRQLEAFNEKIKAGKENAEEEVRARLDQLEKGIEQDRAKLEKAQAELKHWAEAKKDATAAQIAEWKAKHETRVLEDRAERADRYAAASIEVAAAAIADAQQAALEAWLSRQDANAARSKQAESGR